MGYVRDFLRCFCHLLTCLSSGYVEACLPAPRGTQMAWRRGLGFVGEPKVIHLCCSILTELLLQDGANSSNARSP